MTDLTKSRQFQFAIGAVAIILLIRWLLTGELLMVAQAAQPPADGNVSSITLGSVLIPMAIDAVVLIGAAVIAGWMRLWGVLTALVDQITQRQHGQSVQASPTPRGGSDLAMELARAVATDDREASKKLQREIRRPYLVNEIARMASEGDLAAADKLLGELRQLDGIASEPAKAVQRGKN